MVLRGPAAAHGPQSYAPARRRLQQGARSRLFLQQALDGRRAIGLNRDGSAGKIAVLQRQGSVISVSAAPRHEFSKIPAGSISLVKGLGVEGDAHMGVTVKHRTRVERDPTQPNLRQVHLVHAELFDELARAGFDVAPGTIGENITTAGIDLLALPRGAVLRIGRTAAVAVTGLRNPCSQLDDYRKGLMRAVLGRSEDGRIIRKAGIMAVVTASGVVRRGDAIEIDYPPQPHLPLEPV
jgi:MOSC domain-containing protein YiiM